jgi:hypothetical protein
MKTTRKLSRRAKSRHAGKSGGEEEVEDNELN